MELKEVEEQTQFNDYYYKNKLHSTKEKIDNLLQTMGIIATRCDEAETEDEELKGLEELALLGYWRISQ